MNGDGKKVDAVYMFSAFDCKIYYEKQTKGWRLP
jgi:hypothetical protein